MREANAYFRRRKNEKNAQTGYIELEDGTLLKGYIKTVRNINDAQPLLELWKTKTDKAAVRYYRSDVEDFAMAGDTFRILKNFQPFYSEEFFLHDIEAEIIERGRIEPLKATNPYYKNHAWPMLYGGAVAAISISLFNEPIENIPELYVLRTPRNNFMRGVPDSAEGFLEAVIDFIPPQEIKDFVDKNGKLNLRKLRKVVTYVNDRHGR